MALRFHQMVWRKGLDRFNTYWSDEIRAYVTEVIAPRNISVTSRLDRLIQRIQDTNQGATLCGNIFVRVFVIIFTNWASNP